MKSKVILDSHLHIYKNFNLSTLFDKLLDNMLKIDKEKNAYKVAFLTESKDNNFFAKLNSLRSIEGYNIQTNCSYCLKITRNTDQESIYLIKGRQVVCQEGLEVLTIGDIKYIEDKTPIKEVLKINEENNCISIIPWGVGKWFFNRGNIVRELIKENKYNKFFLGDNSARNGLFPNPVQFKEAESKNIKTIAGSDPLPFKGEEKQAGCYCSIIEWDFDEDKPEESVFQMLIENKSDKIENKGKRDHLIKFFKRQIQINLLKH